MPTNMTTLGEVSDRVDALNKDCHDALVEVPAISFESRETMKIGDERHTLRTVAQRSILWRLGIPYNYLTKCPVELQAEQMNPWIKHEKREQLYVRFEGQEVRAIFTPRDIPVDDFHGGMVLHYGKIAELRTGEGTTLMAILPAYLNALSGKGVHVVTVNDYLAARDAEWMGKLYQFLGLSVGVILTSMEHADKQAAYGADITYGTNNEFGFDYLRDNMAASAGERFQRGLNFAIVDEVDSILIDEARTPLIISGQAEDNLDVYLAMDKLAPSLKRQADENAPGDYHVDEQNHQINMTEKGRNLLTPLVGDKDFFVLPDVGTEVSLIEAEHALTH